MQFSYATCVLMRLQGRHDERPNVYRCNDWLPINGNKINLLLSKHENKNVFVSAYSNITTKN